MKFILVLILTLAVSTCENAKKQIDVSTFFGTELKVVSINNTAVDKDLALTITFNTNENAINGFAGCNRFFGTYSLNENQLTFSKIGATKMRCVEERKNQAEQSYLNALQKVAFYTITNTGAISLIDKEKKEVLSLSK